MGQFNQRLWFKGVRESGELLLALRERGRLYSKHSMATMYPPRTVGEPGYSSPTNSQNNHVRFIKNTNRDEYQEERKKYLTAKYGAHQMKLIRKRLAVEEWVDTQLRQLYNIGVSKSSVFYSPNPSCHVPKYGLLPRPPPLK